MAEVKKRSRLQIWQDVIFAIFLREIRSKFDDKIGISWAVLQPVAFIFILSFIRGRMDGGLTHSMPTFVFMLYGMVFIQLFLTTLSSATNAISRNRSLFAFRQVKPISAVIAAVLFDIIVKVFILLTLALCMYLMGIEVIVDDPLSILYLLFNIWLLGTALGLMFGIGKLFISEIDKIRNLLTRPLFFISGVFFSLQDVPKMMWPYLDWNPILHAIELSRDAAYSNYGAEGVSYDFINILLLAFFSFSLTLYQATWKKAISR